MPYWSEDILPAKDNFEQVVGHVEPLILRLPEGRSAQRCRRSTVDDVPSRWARGKLTFLSVH